jgi:hypothetical protein
MITTVILQFLVNILLPMLIAVWLNLVLYFSTEYHNSGENVIFCLQICS